ncbi:MAG: threonylcarbamoyl-AMP synthase [Paludibacteraceae bacterium]|jgi:L-threonylcarbamoyladenylate synthase|nr:threonylcarbamoyl-AMP synthase [Paludibacteraceae bacterium]MDI9537487.1 L-threonylcarbamoyladenylate synthase [Bacteroidota bacterium]HHT61064.1 threonylcarbamoyl-AMP synthase [Bacteroidales bacterium]MBP9038949.1 threonylcarbamoyl-AMP synthase [Paludibacteraceae bacterium]HOH71632.1 L-threonylcarbamoyladenylate synthase [Paludibacteraceae bacterium]
MNETLKKAVEVLRQGGVILYPTDTIWGLGCDATNATAVQRIYDIKQRTNSKAMLVLIDSSAKLQGYVREVPDIAWDLIDLSEKPLTIIYSGAKNLAENLVAEDGSIGIRITRETFSKRLCEQFRKPIVSTSANISNTTAPKSFSEIDENIKNNVDYIVDYRQNEKIKATASSIIKLEVNGQITIIRK